MNFPLLSLLDHCRPPLGPSFIQSMKTAEKYALTQNDFHKKAEIELESLTTETNSRG